MKVSTGKRALTAPPLKQSNTFRATAEVLHRSYTQTRHYSQIRRRKFAETSRRFISVRLRYERLSETDVLVTGIKRIVAMVTFVYVLVTSAKSLRSIDTFRQPPSVWVYTADRQPGFHGRDRPLWDRARSTICGQRRLAKLICSVSVVAAWFCR